MPVEHSALIDVNAVVAAFNQEKALSRTSRRFVCSSTEIMWTIETEQFISLPDTRPSTAHLVGDRTRPHIGNLHNRPIPSTIQQSMASNPFFIVLAILQAKLSDNASNQNDAFFSFCLIYLSPILCPKCVFLQCTGDLSFKLQVLVQVEEGKNTIHGLYGRVGNNSH